MLTNTTTARRPRLVSGIFGWAIMLAGSIAVGIIDRSLAAPIAETNPPVLPGTDDSTPVLADPRVPSLAAPSGAGNVWSVDPRLQLSAVAVAGQSLREGNIAQCMKHLEQAVAEHPALPPPELLLVYLHLANDRLAPAQVALERAATLHKRHPEVYLTCGQVALARGQLVNAWVHFQAADRLPPPANWSEPYRAVFRRAVLAGLAAVCERRGDWLAAAEIFRQWAELEPAGAGQLDRWAKSLFRVGRTTEAFDKFAAAHKADPSQNPPELSMAAEHMELGKFDEAKVWYERALNTYPDDGRVYFEYSGALMIAGHFTQAQAQIDRAVEIGTHLEGLAVDVALLQGLLARQAKNYAQAEEFLTDVLEQSPGHSQAMSQLPLVLVEQDDDSKRQQALQLATLHTKKRPGSPSAWATLGWVCYRLGKIDQAEQALRQAARRDDGETLFFLAQVLLERDKTDEAQAVIRSLQAALNRPGLFLLRDDAQKWLKTVSLAFQ